MMFYTAPLTDPGSGNTLLSGVAWVRNVITGTPATVVATLAVAGIGLLMLQGRLPFRRGATVILGAFIIFGAATTAKGLLELAQAGGSEYEAAQGPVGSELPPPAIKPPAQPQAYDPYGGASVPIS